MTNRLHRMGGLICSLVAVFSCSGIVATSALATFPGANGNILVTSFGESFDWSQSEVWSVDPVGGGVVRIAGGPEEWGSGDGQWSPDGSRVTYRKLRENWWSVWVAPATGNNRQRLKKKSEGASWTPEGRVLIQVPVEGKSESTVFVMDATPGSTPQTLLTTNSRDYRNFFVSPTAANPRLALVHSNEVDTSSLDGNQEVWLTNTPRSDGHVERVLTGWSPDGREVGYFSIDRSRNFHTWIQVADGTATPREILPPVGFNAVMSPVSSPDGKRLALAARKAVAPHNWELLIVDAHDGGNPVRVDLSNTVVTSTLPNVLPTDWQALPALSPAPVPTSALPTPLPQVAPTVAPAAPTTNKRKAAVTQAIASAKINKKRFRAGQKQVFFNVALTQKARIKITFKRAGKVVGTKTYNGKPGANKLAFTGKATRKGKQSPLAPGKYVAVVIAEETKAKKAAGEKVQFQILR